MQRWRYIVRPTGPRLPSLRSSCWVGLAIGVALRLSLPKLDGTIELPGLYALSTARGSDGSLKLD
ncbi:MAG: hypothetical protein ACREYE_27775 [Gammaproteobacteria bacterium]